MENLTTWITFLPLLGAAVVVLIPGRSENALRLTALAFATATFVLSARLWAGFDGGDGGFQFLDEARWIPQYGIAYSVGVDGISLFLVILTTFMVPVTLLAAWRDITMHVRAFLAAMLALETGMLGAFVSLNVFLFYIFWEAMLVPMYLIIGVWGGPRRIYAAVKFFLYTLIGSLLMLLAIIYLYILHHEQFGAWTFDLLRLYEVQVPLGEGWLGPQTLLFLAFGLAFAVKVPVWPFHTWLPDAHVEAPTAGSVILAAILLKMGTYGFLRFSLPLFPDATVQLVPWVFCLAIIGIIYGALVAMVQADVKKLVAYSSVSHLGFVMLGMFALNLQGVQGGLLQMVNHGLSTGALFILVGMIYERRHTRMIADFGGLSKSLPILAAFFLVVTFSSIGLPGLNGFIGEFLVLLGVFKVSPWSAALAATGVILAAVYMLWMVQRVFFGPCDREENKGLQDLSLRELAVLIAVVLPIVWIGVHPGTFTSKTGPAVAQLLQRVESKSAGGWRADGGQPDEARLSSREAAR
ncbi:MAG: NADH-quinone oxidoreductase subunit M [Deltaproteobacteria bacterium]|nr:NADH-quinone oxidoreductase subunit M [Deltaproteobacteria bacterium]